VRQRESFPRTVRPAGTRASTRPPDDDGQVLLLSIAYGLLALLLVGIVVSASAVHLARKELLRTADLAALEAADTFDVDAYFQGGTTLRLTDDGVAASVEAYLRQAPQSGRFSDLQVIEATTTDGRTARVTLRAVADVPLLNSVTAAWSDGVELEVTSHARAGG
jgi:uncharacterized membrane protein